MHVIVVEIEQELGLSGGQGETIAAMIQHDSHDGKDPLRRPRRAWRREDHQRHLPQRRSLLRQQGFLVVVRVGP